MTTAIINARIFDGEKVLDARSVTLNGGTILGIGGPLPAGATIIDAQNGTLLPGLIDAHVHTTAESLRDALRFGVTTELEMMGHWSAEERREVAESDDMLISDQQDSGSRPQTDTRANSWAVPRPPIRHPPPKRTPAILRAVRMGS